MVAILDDEFTVSEETLLCAFSYALGRKTYVVGIVVRDIQENAELISSQSRRTMIKEINDKWAVNALGHENDRRQWVQLLKQLQEIESESQLI